MEVNDLTSTIISDAKKQKERIVSGAKKEKKTIISDAEKKAEIFIKEADKEAGIFIQNQRLEKIAGARLEAKKFLSEAKEDTLNNERDEIFKRFPQFKKTREYAKIVNELAKRAVKEIGGPTILHISKGEKKFYKGIKAAIKEDLLGATGFIAESKNGRVKVDCTFETLFRDKREEMRKRIAEFLFK
ncbi:V-type ATP synthase subunit E [Candidatus Micrarchaeota archaeon]|nr:V-type ATP synthase subunit E [Candidatus Micrarchaeota archaeon]